jgi:hypothetical protein
MADEGARESGGSRSAAWGASMPAVRECDLGLEEEAAGVEVEWSWSSSSSSWCWWWWRSGASSAGMSGSVGAMVGFVFPPGVRVGRVGRDGCGSVGMMGRRSLCSQFLVQPHEGTSGGGPADGDSSDGCRISGRGGEGDGSGRRRRTGPGLSLGRNGFWSSGLKMSQLNTLNNNEKRVKGADRRPEKVVARITKVPDCSVAKDAGLEGGNLIGCTSDKHQARDGRQDAPDMPPCKPENGTLW